ncbi:CPBP family intramembrane glutamic endopeptidase [Haloarchaeobius sp. DT45]|uniref:CPBP family intramembrane glutamic endopeptidase n=1 Tax=Haloarchaeobius sp. DT45 TaxID=3446116 RepID=UPI003F6A570C
MTEVDETGSVSRGANPGQGTRSYLGRTARVFLAGLVGVVGLVLTSVLVPETLPSLPDVPRSVLLVVTLVQPAVLVLVAAAVGTRLAPAVGFRSYIATADTAGAVLDSLRPESRVAIPAGLGAGVLIVVVDLAFRTMTDFGTTLAPAESVTITSVLASFPLRFLYGGITEEVLLRWGFMTVLVWLLWRVTGRPERPSPTAVWVGIVVAAVVFGAGHLPAVALETTLTATVVVRTLVLNSIGGIVFGWLYWRYSLEAAMLAHASAHVALAAPALVAAA